MTQKIKDLRSSQAIMSQDAEDGPELLIGENKSFTTRPPMNQDEFDKRFGYSRPTHKYNAVTRRFGKCIKHYAKPFQSCQSFINFIIGFVPIISWLPKYQWKNNILNDLIGGLTVGVMHVPQGIAYAILAKVPPIVGLYTSFFAPLFYMLFGTSKHISIGSFAVISLMAGLAIESVLAMENEVEFSDRAIVISSTLAFFVGIIHLIMGILRLEIITTYFSDQVVGGFTTATSFHVLAAQMRDFFGLKKLPRHVGAGNFFKKFYDIFYHLPQTNIITLLISISTLIFLTISKDYLNPLLKRKGIPILLPFELIIIVFWTTISGIFNFVERFNVRIVQHIPTGIHSLITPDFSLCFKLLPQALSIAFVVLAIHISLGKMFAKKIGYKIDPGQELYALGLSSSLASFFTMYPISCSLGRSLVNVETGTKTQLSIFFSSVLLGSIIIYVGQWLKTLPMCVLTAIIIVALKGMFKKFKELKTLWPLSKVDFCIWLVSFIATIGLDVTEGLLVSICFALMTTVFRTQWPRWHYLGNLNGTNDFRDSERYSRVINYSGICIFRFDSPLLFTNVESFKHRIHKAFVRWNNECPRALTAQDLMSLSEKSKNKLSINSKSFKRISSFKSIDLTEKKENIIPEKAADYLNTVISTKSQTKQILQDNLAAGILHCHFVIDCSGFTFVDYMGVNALKEIFTEMRSKKVVVYFAAAKASVRDLFELSGFYQYVPKHNFYPTIRDAVAIARKRQTDSTLHLLEELLLTYDTLQNAINFQPMD